MPATHMLQENHENIENFALKAKKLVKSLFLVLPSPRVTV
jgi:hypothetical protein